MAAFFLPIIEFFKNPAFMMSLFGVIAVALLVVAKNHEIHGLENQINNPKSGFVVRLANAHDALVTERNNTAVLTQSLQEQGDSIKLLGQKADTANNAWAAVQGQLSTLHSSIASRISTIDSAKPGADRCASALQLLKGAAQ